MDDKVAKVTSFTLQQVLSLRDAPFIEAHAWAVAHQALDYLHQLFNGKSTVYFEVCDLSCMSLSADGTISWKAIVKNDAVSARPEEQRQEIRITIDEFFEVLGNSLYDGLCLHVAGTRKSIRQRRMAPIFSPALENLLNVLRFQRVDAEVASDSSALSDIDKEETGQQNTSVFSHSIAGKRHAVDSANLIQISKLRFAGCLFETRLDERRSAGNLCSMNCNNVQEHYTTVCRTLFLQTLRSVSLGRPSAAIIQTPVQGRTSLRLERRRVIKPNAIKQLLNDADSDELDDANGDTNESHDFNALVAQLNSESDEEAISVASSSTFTSVSLLNDSVARRTRLNFHRTGSEIGYPMEQDSQDAEHLPNPKRRSKLNNRGTLNSNSSAKKSTLNAHSAKSVADSSKFENVGTSSTVGDAPTVSSLEFSSQVPRDEQPGSDVSSTLTGAVQRRKIVPTASDLVALRDELSTDSLSNSGEKSHKSATDVQLKSKFKAIEVAHPVSKLPLKSDAFPEPHLLPRTNLQPFADPLSQFAREVDNGEAYDSEFDDSLESVQTGGDKCGATQERPNAFASTVSSFVSALRSNFAFDFASDGANQPPSNAQLALDRERHPLQSESATEDEFIDSFPKRSLPLNGSRSIAEPPSMQLIDEIEPQSNFVPPVLPHETSVPGSRPWRRRTPIRSAAGSCIDLTLEEIAYMQGVANEAELETLAIDSELYSAVANGSTCFNCLKTRLGLIFDRGISCSVCTRRVCQRCITQLRVPDTRALFKLPIVFVLESNIAQRQRPNSVSDAQALAGAEFQNRSGQKDWKPVPGAAQLIVCLACYCVIVDNLNRCRTGLAKRH